MPSSHHLILVAAGSGSRMNNELPKQFVKVNDKEIVLRCIEKFRTFDPAINIIIAVGSAHMPLMQQILDKASLKNIRLCEGGQTRFLSVKNALNHISGDGIVGIHDAARPFVSMKTITDCFNTAAEKGNAIPAIPVKETLRHLADSDSVTVPRNEYMIVQTPQCFRTSEIRSAFLQEYSDKFTDDAAVLEASGKKINLVQGNPENIKITYPVDLIIAKALADAEQ